MIGQNILKHRQQRGLTIEGLAYENDLSKGYLSDIEKGKKIPSILMLHRISSALEVDLKDFFSN